jgi:Flagellar biosynthesis protein, FliO
MSNNTRDIDAGFRFLSTGYWLLATGYFFLAPARVCDLARADEAPPTAAIGGGAVAAGVRDPFPAARGADGLRTKDQGPRSHPLPAARGSHGRGPGEASGGSGGGWLGAAGLALALALCGGIGLALRRVPRRADSSLLQVVGRVSLSPRHSVVLLRIGDRVLIVGAGTQGPPALLGELSDPDVLRRLGLGPLGDPDPPGDSGPGRRMGEDR